MYTTIKLNKKIFYKGKYQPTTHNIMLNEGTILTKAIKQ